MRPLWLRCIFVVSVAVATPLVMVSAQSGANIQLHTPGRLLGVFDEATGQPVGGAEVLDLTTQKKTLTSSSGAVSLSFLGPGVTVLQIRKIGYASRMQPVSVSPADTVSITLLLKPLSQQLPEVLTTAPKPTTGKLGSFEQHLAGGFGHFITREQLAKAQGRLTSDVFRTIPGMILWPDPHGTAWYVGTSRGLTSILRNGENGVCFAAVMLDGIVLPTPFNINTLRPEDMAGVEYYAGGSSMPAAYNSTRAACGLVVIWTR